MPYFPALNEITRQTGIEEPKFPDEPEDLHYLILYPEDYQGHGIDVEGNVALLVDEENAREVKRLAENIIDELSDDQPDDPATLLEQAGDLLVEARDQLDQDDNVWDYIQGAAAQTESAQVLINGTEVLEDEECR